MGWGYFKLKDFEQAELYLIKAIQRLPDDPVINDHMGDLYFQMKQNEKAVKYWNKALETNIEDKERVKKKIERVIKE